MSRELFNLVIFIVVVLIVVISVFFVLFPVVPIGLTVFGEEFSVNVETQTGLEIWSNWTAGGTGVGMTDDFTPKPASAEVVFHNRSVLPNQPLDFEFKLPSALGWQGYPIGVVPIGSQFACDQHSDYSVSTRMKFAFTVDGERVFEWFPDHYNSGSLQNQRYGVYEARIESDRALGEIFSLNGVGGLSGGYHQLGLVTKTDQFCGTNPPLDEPARQWMDSGLSVTFFKEDNLCTLPSTPVPHVMAVVMLPAGTVITREYLTQAFGGQEPKAFCHTAPVNILDASTNEVMQSEYFPYDLLMSGDETVTVPASQVWEFKAVIEMPSGVSVQCDVNELYDPTTGECVPPLGYLTFCSVGVYGEVDGVGVCLVQPDFRYVCEEGILNDLVDPPVCEVVLPSVGVCPEGTMKEGDKCYFDLPVTGVCPEDSFLDGNQCYYWLPVSAVCPEGSELVDDDGVLKCVYYPNVEYLCVKGSYDPSIGKCLFMPEVETRYECGSGGVLDLSVDPPICRKELPPTGVCPEGTQKVVVDGEEVCYYYPNTGEFPYLPIFSGDMGSLIVIGGFIIVIVFIVMFFWSRKK